MINLFVWPIAILVFILLAIYVRKNMHKIMKPSIRKTLLISYISILSLASIGFFIIQPSIETLGEEIDEPPYLNDFLLSNVNFELIEPFKQGEWDIVAEDGKVRLNVTYNGNYIDAYVPVVIIEDETKTDTAHIVYYETPTVLNKTDISSYIDIAKADVSEEGVTIEFASVEDEYVFQAIHKDMVLYQFKDSPDENMFFDFYMGEMALVLYVPKGTAVVADLNHFDIIRK